MRHEKYVDDEPARKPKIYVKYDFGLLNEETATCYLVTENIRERMKKIHFTQTSHDANERNPQISILNGLTICKSEICRMRRRLGKSQPIIFQLTSLAVNNLGTRATSCSALHNFAFNLTSTLRQRLIEARYRVTMVRTRHGSKGAIASGPPATLPAASPAPTSKVPSQIRFPLLVLLSMGLSSFLYAVASPLTTGDLSVISRTHDEWWEIAVLLGWKAGQLAVGWYGGYDSTHLVFYVGRC